MALKNVPPPPPSHSPPQVRTGFKNSSFLDYVRYSEFKRLLGQLVALTDAKGDPIRSLAVLSEHPQEGKTFFVAAMALGYASLLNRRVLIVNTVIHSQSHSLQMRKLYEEQLEYAPIFGGRVTQATRMIDLVSPEIDESQTDSADAADFHVGTYLESLRESYDLVLLDTCALTAANKKNIDPIVVARQADSSILITSDRSLNHESLRAVKDLLAQWQVRLSGIIHNTGSKNE